MRRPRSIICFPLHLYMIVSKNAASPHWLRLLPVALLAVAITILGFFPSFVENVYSTTLYPAISLLLRLFTRWIPFSLGDLIYIVFIFRIVLFLTRFIVAVVRKTLRSGWLARSVFWSVHFLLWAYIVFKLLWALNYDRLGIGYQLQVKQSPYTKTELVTLTNQLIDKLNETRRLLPDSVLPEKSTDSLFHAAFLAYQSASFNYDFLNYRNRSVKKSMFTGLADYMGFSGYYNPFTGEAQVRTDIPRILVPYIVCHEMAHQLGYASEAEANFVGYLAASASPDPYVRYSVYLDLFSYAQGEELSLLSQDETRAEFDSIIHLNRVKLDTLVKRDRQQIRAFFYKRSNRISPVVSSVYDQYLKMNKQSDGIRSYNKVIGLLLAYQRRYGRL